MECRLCCAAPRPMFASHGTLHWSLHSSVTPSILGAVPFSHLLRWYRQFSGSRTSGLRVRRQCSALLSWVGCHERAQPALRADRREASLLGTPSAAPPGGLSSFTLGLRMRALAVLVAFASFWSPAESKSSDWSTPEAAFREHQDAWKSRDIPRFLRTISFRRDAEEQLAKEKKVRVSKLLEADVLGRATLLESELRHRLQSRGFRPDELSSCAIVTKWQDSDDQVRFPLRCDGPGGGDSFWPIRLVLSANGWRVVSAP